MYSNCLFEALKAKIKDPKNVKIIRIPKEINHGFSHYMWIKGSFVYHSFDKNYDGEGKPKLLFSCSNKKIPLIVFQRWLLGKAAETKNLKKYTKKFNLPLRKMEAVESYTFHFVDPIDGSQKDDWTYDSYEEVKRIMKREHQIKVIHIKEKRLEIMTFDKLKKVDHPVQYKFFTPYDEDFKSVYPCASKLEKATVLQEYGEEDTK